MVQDIVAILEACQQDAEPEAAATRGCHLLASRTNAAGVAVFGADDDRRPVVMGRTGRPPSVVVATRVIRLAAPLGPERGDDGWEAAWPVRHGEAVIGALACRWAAHPTSDAVSLAQAAVAALAPVVSMARHGQRPAATGDELTLMGASDGIGRVRRAIDRAGPAPFPVLIEGESGAGKELVARAIHLRSPRHARRFCALELRRADRRPRRSGVVRPRARCVHGRGGRARRPLRGRRRRHPVPGRGGRVERACAGQAAACAAGR